MAFYLVEFVRVGDHDERQVIARYKWPEAIVAETTLAELTEDAIIGELKRRWQGGDT